MDFNRKKGKKNESGAWGAFWVMILPIIIRIVLSVIYVDDYYLPFIGIKLHRIISWLLYWILIFANMSIMFKVDRIRNTWLMSIVYSCIPALVSLTFYYVESYPILFFSLIVIVFVVAYVIPTIQYENKTEKAKRLHRKLKSKKVKKRLYGKAYTRVAYIATLVVLGFTVACIYNPSLSKRGNAASVDAAIYEVGERSLLDMLDEHKDELIVLQNGRYNKASMEERLNALQVLLNIEVSYFGLEDSPVLKTQDVESYIGGYYSERDRTVIISSKYLEDKEHKGAENAVFVTLHEGRHFWQHRIVEYAENNNYDLSLPLYSDIRDFKDNIDSYVDYKEGEDDISVYMTYRTQPIESDAFSYGDNVGLQVMSHINSWY